MRRSRSHRHTDAGRRQLDLFDPAPMANAATMPAWTALTLATVVNCFGIGFQRGTHTRWQIVHNDGSSAPTLINASSTFSLSTDAVVTLIVAAAPNAGSVWVRIIDEPSGTVFERELTSDLPATTQFLSPRLYMNNGATASAVAFDCSGCMLRPTTDRCTAGATKKGDFFKPTDDAGRRLGLGSRGV